METLMVRDEAYEALVEELESIVVEKVYESNLAKAELFWMSGEAIRGYATTNDKNITEVVQTCAKDNRLHGKQMGERNLWWAVKIFDAYPDKNFPDDKATSLTKIKKLLTDGGNSPAPTTPDVVVEADKLISKYGLEFAQNVAKEIQTR